MFNDELQAFFSTQDATFFSLDEIPLKGEAPFKNHPQFPILVDSLIRMHRHHLILEIDFSIKIVPFLLFAFLDYLTKDNVPYPLQGAKAIYLNDGNLSFNALSQKRMDDKIILFDEKKDKYLLIAFSDTYLLTRDESLYRQLKKFDAHPNCRLIFFKTNKKSDGSSFKTSYLNLLKDNESEWATYRISNPNQRELISILKEQSETLEKFHQVVIPEEIIRDTYVLAERYLNANHPLEHALLLLDTSAARAKSYQLGQAHHHQMKTILTFKAVMEVLSSWTNIPTTHLLSSSFKLNDFSLQMNEQVIGQVPAITLLGQAIQQSLSSLTPNQPIVGAYLFAGPANVGKKTCAGFLADQLYKSRHMLYIAEPFTKELTSLVDLKLKCNGLERYVPLYAVIQDCPYAILIFEAIEGASSSILNSLRDLCCSGYLYDALGNQYNFRHAILILTTTAGSLRLIKLNETFTHEIKPEHIDLVQLVMNEKKQTPLSTLPFSPQDLIEEISPEINSHLPASLCQALNIIPFLPLTFESIEIIMRAKLNVLSHSLYLDHTIHFNYAPEVLNYLVNKALKQQKKDSHEWKIDHILKNLHATIRQAIEHRSGHSYNHRQLLLQLNETGTLLRCEWSREIIKQHDKAKS